MVEARASLRLSESVESSRTRCSLCCSLGSRSLTRDVMKRIFATIVSREARNGDSAAPTFSRFDGTATAASSLLISLTSRVFSATSCIRRSLSADAWDRLSILACASGEGPCLQPAAMSRARGSHAAPAARRLYLNMFRNLLLENWGDLRHTAGCRGANSLGMDTATPQSATWFRRNGPCSLNQ